MNASNSYAPRVWLTTFWLCLCLAAPLNSYAYVGPGAGFAFVSSFFILFFAFILAFATLLTWPLRWAFKALLRMRRARRGRMKRVVVLGLDGQDPELTEQWMTEGRLPNFARLRDEGSFHRLGTTLPAESPVAWSSFQTGCNPGKHRIFDFLVPNHQAMTPELSSANVRSNPRSLRIGPYAIPLGKPRIQLGRRSEPFWQILSRYGIFSSILRVPITFPPDKFDGVLLSAMCLPDLRGSQGTYFYFTSDPDETRNLTSGELHRLHSAGDIYQGYFPGPRNTMHRDQPEMTIAFSVEVDQANPEQATLSMGKETQPLRIKQYTPYIRLQYAAGLGVKVHGLCRIMLLETRPHVRLYVTPIQIDPEKPALPISYPYTYSVYLAKQQGAYSTLGVAEDTSALNEGIIDEEAFLAQCQSIHHERETMFFDSLEKTPQGVVACVFDITDRLQHMFFRFHDQNHPACPDSGAETYRGQLLALYEQMDELLGRVRQKLDDDTLLLVMSDHGFKPFRRGVNLNRWLFENGYLHLQPGVQSLDMLQGVDWSQTTAYALGFGGIYINRAGRESKGIVKQEDAGRIKEEIRAGLFQLFDEQQQQSPIREVYDTQKTYRGPYVNDAPDLMVGFQVGYRASWATVTGGMGESLIEDNTRPWSGDHNMNPGDVPGMLFSNRALDAESPHITDLAPTILDVFGIHPPAHMDGRAIHFQKAAQTNAPEQPSSTHPLGD